MITAKEARRIWRYEPLTGEFFWRAKVGPKIIVGNVAGSVNGKNRWQLRYRDKTYTAARVAWLIMTGEWPKDEIDHIDTDRRNDRFANLRKATRSQNQQNKKYKNNSLGLKGIRLLGSKYQARIKANGKVTYLGGFETASEAKAARDLMMLDLHKEFACA